MQRPFVMRNARRNARSSRRTRRPDHYGGNEVLQSHATMFTDISLRTPERERTPSIGRSYLHHHRPRTRKGRHVLRRPEAVLCCRLSVRPSRTFASLSCSLSISSRFMCRASATRIVRRCSSAKSSSTRSPSTTRTDPSPTLPPVSLAQPSFPPTSFSEDPRESVGSTKGREAFGRKVTESVRSTPEDLYVEERNSRRRHNTTLFSLLVQFKCVVRQAWGGSREH